MNIHEYQSKELFKKYSIPVPEGCIASKPEEVKDIISKLGSNVVVKAQVHAGGRGKAGGVKLVNTPEEAVEFANHWLGKRLITYQTDSNGQLVNSILVEGGTKRGTVRFIRLRYSGGDWEQDLNRNSDLNMLLWYAANTGHKTAKKPEVRSISQLKQFPSGKSPPLVYMTGQENIRLSKKETEILQEYILDNHGMIFADNGGSSGWHSQFFSLKQVNL